MTRGDIGRKKLPHDPSPEVIPNCEFEVFFITICCSPRCHNQLAVKETWNVLQETLRHRESLGHWRVSLLLAMPDHLHALCAFDGTRPMHRVIADFKSWVSRKAGVRWQRDFFDHRLRSWESAAEKRNYILKNPVRAKCILEGESWPYVVDRFG